MLRAADPKVPLVTSTVSPLVAVLTADWIVWKALVQAVPGPLDGLLVHTYRVAACPVQDPYRSKIETQSAFCVTVVIAPTFSPARRGHRWRRPARLPRHSLCLHHIRGSAAISGQQFRETPLPTKTGLKTAVGFITLFWKFLRREGTLQERSRCLCGC
jgi:hypothetical protein